MSNTLAPHLVLQNIEIWFGGICQDIAIAHEAIARYADAELIARIQPGLALREEQFDAVVRAWAAARRTNLTQG